MEKGALENNIDEDTSSKKKEKKKRKRRTIKRRIQRDWGNLKQEEKNKLLIKYIEKENYTKVKTSLENGADPNTIYYTKTTSEKIRNTSKGIIKTYAVPTLLTVTGFFYFRNIFRKNAVGLPFRKLEKDFNGKLTNLKKSAIKFFVSAIGFYALSNLFIKRKKIEGIIKGKNTVLHLAAYKNNPSITKLLLEYGAEKTINSDGKFPHECCIEGSNTYEILIEKKEDRGCFLKKAKKDKKRGWSLFW